MGSNTANTKMLWDELKERIQIKHKKEIPISLEELCSVDVISSHWTEILPSYVIPGSAKTRWSGGAGDYICRSECAACLSACDRLSICAGCFLAFTPGALPDSFQPCINSHGCTNDKTVNSPSLCLIFLHQIFYEFTWNTRALSLWRRASSAKCSRTNNFEAFIQVTHQLSFLAHCGTEATEAIKPRIPQDTLGSWKIFK